MPESLKEIYTAHLNFIQDSIREQNPETRNSIEEIELSNRILSAQLNYCGSWLDPNKDELYEAVAEAWPQLRAQDEDIEQESFDDWVEHLTTRSLNNIMPQATGWVMNTPQISRGVKHTGYFNAQQDMDGTIRRSRLVARTGNHYMPSIALKAYLVGNDYNAEIRLQENLQNPGTKKIESLIVTDNNTGEPVHKVPVDGEGLLKINYAGPQKMFTYVSLSDMLTDTETMTVEQAVLDPASGKYEVDPKGIEVNKREFMKDKFFILGATAIGIFDLRVTPFDENFPGAETHVNVLDNLMRQDFFYQHPDEETMMLIVMLVIGIVISFALAKLGAVSGLALTSLTLASIILYDRFFLFLTFYKYFTEERNKKELRSTFQKYVSPAIVDEVLKNPKNIELGGRKEDITVLFSDIRGFTTISEKLDPRALSDLLNSYLTPMTDLVFENRGTLDKYMGDAVMAFFGAPIHYDEHPKYASRCALAMLVKLKELQKQYREQGLPEIDIGIGLNSGECSVGKMGSETVRSDTVMGDAVNLGSRLEGINKQYGTRIIISEFTYAKVKDEFVCREIDLVRVKGKVLPVRIYELVAEGSADDETMKKIDFFNKGYQLYHQKEFTAAIEQFNNGLNISPDDACCKLYIERSQNYLNEPPPADWDGVFIMTTK
jgi:adenylate cyclase